MASIVIRICLRYIAAFLVARGALSQETADMVVYDGDISAGVEMAAGSAIGFAVEGWYWLERRYGWDV